MLILLANPINSPNLVTIPAAGGRENILLELTNNITNIVVAAVIVSVATLLKTTSDLRSVKPNDLSEVSSCSLKLTVSITY